MNVLIADDSPSIRQFVKAVVDGCGLTPTLVRDGAEACNILLDASPPQIAIIDWFMPGMDGVDICRKVRERADGAYIYIIMLTSRDTKEDMIDGLTAGADDYLTKPFDPAELRSRIRSGRRIVELNRGLLERQDELIRLNEHLEALATRDGLTNLWNHRSFQEQFANEFSRAKRHMRELSLILLDVDFFKQFNDTFGHQAGDEVLRSVARVLQTAARQIDIVARYGGEEFAIILPDEDVRTSTSAAERFRAAIESADWPVRPVAASFGVATLKRSYIDPAAMIADADRALYQSKRTGRNRVTHEDTI
jgi:diguanylate cyclase (GGDEF)-like protein